MKRVTFVLACLCSVVTWDRAADAGPADEIVVVVHKSSAAKSLTREDLRPIFQTTKSTMPDGSPAEPINLADDSPVRHDFDLAVLGLDPDRVARYWIDRKIRGGERPPRKVTVASAAVRSASTDKSVISYVRVGDANDSVKIVARIRNGEVVSP